MPLRKGQTQLKLVPPYEDWVLELMTRADYDEYWAHPSLNPSAHWHAFPDMPVLYVGGWYDSYTRATFENYLGNGAAKRGPIRVLVGPWRHGATTPEQSHAGDVEFGKEAALASFHDLHVRWFEKWLLGRDNGIEAEAPVRLFVMGGGGGYRTTAGRLMHGGRWRDEHEWPLGRTRYEDFYLHESGALRTSAPNEASSNTTLRFDPANPVPSIGGNVSSLLGLFGLPPGVSDPEFVPRAARSDEIMPSGGYDQVEGARFFGCKPPYLPLGSRADVLVFETEPLAEDVEVTGPIFRDAMGFLERRRHRFHSQADRRLPAERVVSERLPPQFERQHPAPALPALRRQDRLPGARCRRRDRHHALSDEQPFRARPPHPARRVELELPPLRRQSQYWRAARA